MNPEYIETIYIALCGMFFALGGSGFMGSKAIRRFGIPIITGLFLYIHSLNFNIIALISAFLCFSLHLGYGDKKPYWYKFLVGLAWGIPSLLIGFSIWVIILPVLWIILFYASNDDFLESQFTWNVCELLTGIIIGVTYVQALKGAW